MEFRILGPLEVEREGQLLTVGGAKQRAALAVLLLNANRIVSRDRLIDSLWGECPPETAVTMLQGYVSNLRKALGKKAIVTQAPGYLVRVLPGTLDLERFERLVAEAPELDALTAAGKLREALGLWRGLVLEDVTIPLVERERRRLEELRLAALEQRIQADLDLGRHVELVPELETLVRELPLRELLRGQLMLALYRSGRQADALDVYRSGRKLLAEELGLEPGEALKRLERSILEQDPALRAPPVPARPPRMPAGTVTFLFADIEGSTRLVQTLGDDYGTMLDRHRLVLATSLAEHGGVEVETHGDSSFFCFRSAVGALSGAVEAQRLLAGEAWPGAARVRVRMGVHTGETDAENYRGLDVVRAARIADAAHGGQILVSESTRDLVGDRLPEVGFKVLAELRLPSIDRPERVSQVVAAGLDAEFPPLRATETLEAPAFDGRGEELAAAALAAVDAEERRLSLFRRSWVGALAGALLLAGAATGIALALTAGGRSVVTVAPDSVVAVDMGTGAVVADIPIGGRPVGIAIGDGAVWAANADDGTVTRIDPENGRVVKTIGLGTDVNSVAVGFGAVWVAGGNDETLTRINPERNAVEAPLHFGKTDPLFPKPVFFVAAGRNAVWITHGNSVERIDPATNRVLKTVLLQAGPTSLGVGDGSVWVTTADERLVRIDENSNRVTARLLLPNFGTSPVVSQGALWLIVYTDRPQIWRLNPGDLTQTASVPVVAAFPFSLAARAGKVWMVDHTKSVLWRMTRDGSRAARVTTIGFHPIALAVGRRYVWVGVQQQPLR